MEFFLDLRDYKATACLLAGSDTGYGLQQLKS